MPLDPKINFYRLVKIDLVLHRLVQYPCNQEDFCMYTFHGFGISFNTRKVIYVAEELGVRYDYCDLDPSREEHKSEAHLARHPLGKTPTMTHDGKHLFESGAICRYLASVETSDLYPANDLYAKALVDQWLDMFSLHLGRWLGTVLFERVLRPQFGMGETKQDVVEEAEGFIGQQMVAVDLHLANQEYLAGRNRSIADLCAFAYLETTEHSGIALHDYPHVSAWYKRVGALDSMARARARLDSPA